MTESNRRPRRRPAAAPVALLMAGVLLAAQPASALPRCAADTDQTVFEIEALKTELMVVATTCKQEDRYNAFVQKYQPTLAQNGRAFGQYFIRTHGGTRPGQRQNDIYITELANVRSNVARSLGSDYCPRNGGLFDEVMALQSADDLAGGAKTCTVPQAAVLSAGQQVETTMTVDNDGGWCGITVAQSGPKPFAYGTVQSRPRNGRVHIHTVGDNTRVDYIPNAAFGGTDNFAVQLKPGNATMRVAVTVTYTPPPAPPAPPAPPPRQGRTPARNR